MGIDNINLLSVLIITVIIGYMIGWEIGIASGALAGLTCLFVQVSQPNASPLYSIGGIIFTIVFIILGYDSLRRILRKQKFKARLIQLAELYEQGKELSIEAFNTVKDDNAKDVWWQKIENLRDNIYSLMNKINLGDSDKWLKLGKFETKYPNLYSEDMSQKVSEFQALMEKLKKYISSKAGNEPQID